MRIAFLCSGLEPGRDGVGDYTRTLAEACAAAGHPVALASLRDGLASAQPITPGQPEARFQDIFAHKTDAHSFTAWLRAFNPDWVSVQFTPFGFHPRGLGFNRASFLHHLLPANARGHVMYHEIWLEPGWGKSFRRQLLGKLQRRVVQSWGGAGFLPSLVQTQSRLFQIRLNRAAVPAKIFPLCANVAVSPVDKSTARAWLVQSLRSTGANPPAADDSSAYWVGHFGSLYIDHDWDLNAFLKNVAATAARVGKRACFVAIGRLGAGEPAWHAAARANSDVFIGATGALPTTAVSQAIQACDAMFTSTPVDIVEKSAAVTVSRVLELPVLMPRVGATTPGELPAWPDAGLISADQPLHELPQNHIPAPSYLNPATAAHDFIAALNSCPVFPSA